MPRAYSVLRQLLIGAAALLGAVLLLNFLLPDAPKPDDDALFPAPAAAGGEDAYADFVALGKELALTEKERGVLARALQPGATTQADAAPLLAKNASALRRFALFSRRERFSDPSFADHGKVTYQTPLPQFFPLVSGAQLAALSSARALKAGRADEALAQALLITDAAGVLLRSRQPLLTTLIAFKLLGDGTRAVAAVVDSGRASAPALRKAAARLSALPSGAPALAEGLRFEYLAGTHMLEHLPEFAAERDGGRWYFRHAGRSALLYQPMRTRALFAARFRAIVDQVPAPCLGRTLARAEEVRLGVPNFVGRVIYNIALPDFSRILDRRCETDYRAAAAAVAAAARAYRREKGRDPRALADLVPAYLPAAPRDPYSGGPLGYDAQRRRATTAGKDAQGKPLDP